MCTKVRKKWGKIPNFAPKLINLQKNLIPMTTKKKLDRLQRLVNLIADDNELLSRANDFMQTLVDNNVNVHGQHDLSTQLGQKMRHSKTSTPNQ